MNERKDKNKVEEQRRYEKHVRWQEIRITQFGYVNYLILTLASGALAFGASPLLEVDNCNEGLCASALYWVALFFLSLSVIAGSVCAYIRLCDFRKTAKITRLRMKHNGLDPTKEVAKLRCKTKILGERSWQYLRCQMLHFGVGIALFAFAIAGEKFSQIKLTI